MASFESAIPYIKKAEGGLSRATTDTASKNPAPWAYKGVTGWHTNKGITYTTFKGLAAQAGYAVTPENFFTMPDNIWLAIYKIGYWLPMRSNEYNSQAIANLVVDWAWASGQGGATNQLIKYVKSKGLQADGVITSKNAINSLIAKQGERKTFLELIEARKQHFIALRQPANEKGWLARMETLKNEGLKLVTDNGGSLLFFLACLL